MTDLQRIRMWAMGCTFSLGEMTLKDREDMADRLVDWVMGDPGAAHEPDEADKVTATGEMVRQMVEDSLADIPSSDLDTVYDSINRMQRRLHEPVPNFREVHGILRATDEVPL